MRAADHRYNMRLLLFNEDREVDRFHKAGGRGGKSDEFGLGGENGGDVGFESDGGDRSEAIVDGGGVAVFFEPGGQRQNSDGCHAIRQHREVRLPRHEIETCGVDEGDAHGEDLRCRAVMADGDLDANCSSGRRRGHEHFLPRTPFLFLRACRRQNVSLTIVKISRMTDPLISRLKHLIVDTLRLDGVTASDIDEAAPLIGSGLALDSIDALELVVKIEKEFGIKIGSSEESRQALASVNSLATFIKARTKA